MKNGHINTAIKALEKQHKKYVEQSNSEASKAIEHAKNRDFFMEQALLIYSQIDLLKGQNGNKEHKATVAENS